MAACFLVLLRRYRLVRSRRRYTITALQDTTIPNRNLPNHVSLLVTRTRSLYTPFYPPTPKEYNYKKIKIIIILLKGEPELEDLKMRICESSEVSVIIWIYLEIFEIWGSRILGDSGEIVWYVYIAGAKSAGI